MKIAIIGAGTMGKWLADELKQNHRVAVFNINPQRLKFLNQMQVLSSISELKRLHPDMVINAVSLSHTVTVFEEILPFIGTDCILSDITSVKTGLPEFYKRTGRPFVSTHPMFGPTFGNIHDLTNENAIVISESDQSGKTFFETFYKERHINVFYYTFEDHDKTTAYSLSTPFASTMVFAACMKKQQAPGTTFKQHLKIARGLLAEDDYLLSEIMFNPYTISQIEKINSQLTYLTHIIKDKDYEEMLKFLKKLRSNIQDKTSDS